MSFSPTLESVRSHTVPDWFNDAKLGIFVHWGLYSVPGWAPTTGPLHDVVAAQGWRGWFGRNPYAEWYMNSIHIPGSPSALYHAEQFGANFEYADFAPRFNAGVEHWDPSLWAELFAAAGARYAVLTTKHHDGFLLWPSAQPNPFHNGYQSERDLVGDFSNAVRAAGLRAGLYYSGGLDWTFNKHVIADLPDLFRGVPQQAEYIAYADGHFNELIARYAPAVLWNDIGYPAAANTPALFAHYYNSVPEGVINDRFAQADPEQLAANPDAIIVEGTLPKPIHYDFRTPEYTSYKEIVQEKWESTRGLGYSFGYNRNESVNDMLSPAELIRSFVDIVSKNGNLLINVGPLADGTIPPEQRERLLALGAWLGVNNAAIYGSRPWQRAEGRTADGTALRFTQGSDGVYAILLDTPATPEIVIEDFALPDGATVSLLGGGALPAEQRGDHLAVTLPAALTDAPAHTLRVGS